MGKKAPRRNAFFCYMLDYKRREEARGVRFPNGLADVSKAAGESWKLCSQRIKDDYKRKADEYNKSEERNQGQPSYFGNKKKKKQQPTPLNRALTLKEAKQRREKEFIKNLVEGMTINDLLDCYFHLAHVNVFCKTEDDEFVPAELAISRFSLREGVTDVFHRILSPGVTPLGYSYTIKEHSERTHRIPLDFVKATKGYLGIYKGITDFLQPRGNPEQMPILFTMFDEPFHNCSMSAVKYSLKRIWETCNIEDDEEEGEISEDEPYEKVFRVMSLPILFFHLRNKCASVLNVEAVAFENTSEANIELLNDKYEFNEDMACQFHIDIDNVRYCSQSYVVRWGQVIREQCLKNLESDEEEEEQATVTEEVDKIKIEQDLVLKKEKPELEIKKEKDNGSSLRRDIDDREIKRECGDREIKRERDDREIKRERDDREIKRERDDREIKKERDEYRRSSEDPRIKKERDDRHRSYEDSRYKRERDRDYNDERIKRERDRGYSDEHIKRERDRGYNDERIKNEPDRGYDDSRIKKEKDRGYDDVPIKKEQDRGYEDMRLKKERDHPRSSETDSHLPIKPEKVELDCDLILQPEHLDIPLDVKIERPDFSESYSRDSSSSKEVSHSDSHPKLKQEHPNLKTERPDIIDADLDYDSLLKTEHLDIPLDIKLERTDSRDSQVPDSNKSQNSTSASVLGLSHPIAEPNPSNIPIKTERHPDFPLPIEVKDEFSPRTEATRKRTQTSSASDFPLPIEIKDEFPPRIEATRNEAQTSLVSDFPFPIQVKDEFSPRTETIHNRAQTSSASDSPISTLPTMQLKKERVSPPPPAAPGNNTKTATPTDIQPMPIQQERDATSCRVSDIPTTSIKERDTEFPLPIPIKQEVPESTEPWRAHFKRTEKSNPPPPAEDRNDFPLPKKIKIETPESDFATVQIKKEPEDSNDVKNEEIEIDDDDVVSERSASSMPEPMEYTTTYTETVVIKNEGVYESESDIEIKKEKFVD